MTYTLNWTDGTLKSPITVANGTTDTTSTALKLGGYGAAGWGQFFQEDMMHLLENFASATPPTNKTIGQLWFDTGNQILKAWSGTTWIIASGTPQNAVSGVLTADAAVFAADSAGNIASYSNGSTTLKIYNGAIDDSASWTYSKVDGSGVASSISSNTVTITSLTSDSSYVDITATRTGFASVTKRFTVSRAKSGINGSNGLNAVSGVLSLEGIVLLSDSLGNVTSYSGAVSTLKIYAGNLDDSANWTFSKVDSTGLTTAISGNTVTIASLIATQDTAYCDVTATRSGYAPITKRISISKSKTGSSGVNGNNGISATLSPDSFILPADNTGAVTSYANCNATMQVYNGASNDTSNWTFTKVDGPNISSTLSSDVVTVTSLAQSQDTSYVDVTATRSGYASITKRFQVGKSKTGATGATGATGSIGPTGNRGSVQLAGATSGSSWSDSVANSVLTNAGYTYKVIGDMVTLYNTSINYSESRVWNGSAWITIASYINGNLLVNGTIVTQKIVIGACTANAQTGFSGVTKTLINTSSAQFPIGYSDTSIAQIFSCSGGYVRASISGSIAFKSTTSTAAMLVATLVWTRSNPGVATYESTSQYIALPLLNNIFLGNPGVEFPFSIETPLFQPPAGNWYYQLVIRDMYFLDSSASSVTAGSGATCSVYAQINCQEFKV
jgi:hypothetical protein